ncbi:MAG: VCBS repeat-containing protein, partial [Candidatus Zixiibacteriota bacterium]
TWPLYAHPADLDNDGDLDLAVANYGADKVTVLMNDGSGVFSPYTAYPVGIYPRSLVASDFDGDGDLDLVVSNMDSDNISILLNYGNGTFAPEVTYATGDNPSSIFGADFDSDGDIDLAVANRKDNNVSILLNSLPAVISTSPITGEACVDRDADISVRFNMSMDGLTINGSTFQVTGSLFGAYPGTVTYDDISRTAFFDPAFTLNPAETVTVTLTTGIQSITGIPIGSNYTWDFATLWGGLSFRPNPDGWSFPNEKQYLWPGTADFPNWKIWVSAFGESRCYRYYIPLVRSPDLAMWARYMLIRDKWGGSCYGMAISSLLFYNGYLDVLSEFGVPTVYAVPAGHDTRYFINKYHVYQYGLVQLAYSGWNYLFTKPDETLAACKAMFLDGIPDDCALTMLKSSGLEGHCINPYKCGPDPYNSDLFYIYAYDNNYPDDENARVTINTQNNTWSYNRLGSGYGGSKYLYLELPISYYTVRPIKQGEGAFEEAWVNEKSIDLEDYRIFYFSTIDSAIFVSSEYFTGFSTDSVFGTDTTAVPIVQSAGEDSLPLGYLLSRDDWECEFSGLVDSNFQFAVFLDSTVMYYSRDNAEIDEHEHLGYRDNDSSLTVHNPDAAGRLYSLEAISTAADSQFAITVSGINVLPGDSASYLFTDESKLQLDNYGGATTYNLQIELNGQESYGGFYCTEVALGGLTSHRILPDFRAFGDLAMVLIDEGMTGTYSDTIFYANEGLQKCMPGDANNDLAFNLLDILYLIDHVYGDPPGPAPIPFAICSGDPNCDCTIN